MFYYAIDRFKGGLSMFDWFLAYFVAKKLELRDRGMVQKWSNNGKIFSLRHDPCKTRIRIGITEENEAVHYCWRCEYILQYEKGEPDPPDDKEPLPDVTESENVISFPNRKAS